MGARQNRVAIVVDSGAARPIKERLEPEPGWYEVPFNIVGPDETWLDTASLSPERLNRFRTLVRSMQVTTSQPSPGQYLEVYQQAIRDGATGIVVIPMSSGLSQSFNSALQAKEAYYRESPGSVVEIEVVDCLTTSAAQTFIARKAYEVANKGGSTVQVAEAATDALSSLCVAQIVPDLRHLKKGGRIGRLAFIAGITLRVTPVLTVNPSDGKLDPIGKPKTWSKASAMALAYIGERIGSRPVWLALTHYGISEKSEQHFFSLMDEASKFNLVGGLYIAPQPLVLSVYTGEDSVGLIAMTLD